MQIKTLHNILFINSTLIFSIKEEYTRILIINYINSLFYNIHYSKLFISK